MMSSIEKGVRLFLRKEKSIAELCALFYSRILIGRVLSPLWTGLLNVLGRSRVYLFVMRKPCVVLFNKLFYLLRRNTLDSTTFMGKNILKFPTDLWILQEIIYQHKPDVIVEIGVFLGGSTFYLAKVLQMNGDGTVIAVDVTLDHIDPDVAALPNVTLIEGDSTAPDTVSRIADMIDPTDRVMVILDSDHRADHVYREMRLYAPLVTENQYLVVEDGIIDGVYPPFMRSGPRKAIQRFLKTDDGFLPDYHKNRFLLTQNPMGYLLRTKTGATLPFTEANDCLRPLTLWLPGQPPPEGIGWTHLLNQNRRSPGNE